MHKSKYILEIKFNNKFFLLNLITLDFYIIKGKNYYHWINNNLNLIDNKIKNILIKEKFIIKNKNEDYNLLKYAYNIFDKKKLKNNPNYIIFLTDECNLNCIYCYQKFLNKNKFSNNKFMNFNKLNFIIQAINLLNSNNYKNNTKIVLYGGEPLLKKNLNLVKYLFKIIDEKIQNPLIEIISNGVELNYYIPLLKNYNKIIKKIKITIDGINNIHNFRRKYKYQKNEIFDTFNTIINNLNELLKIKNINISINILIDKHNINFLEEFLNYLNEKYIKKYDNLEIEIGRVQFRNDPEGNRYKYNLHYSEFFLKIFDILLNINFPLYKIKFGTEVNFIFKIFNYWNNNKIFIPNLKGCKAINLDKYLFYIDGFIYPCNDLAGLIKYSIGRFIPNFKLNSFYYTLKNFTIFDFDKCRSCKFIFICGGGCFATNIFKNNNMKSNYCLKLEKTLKKFIIYLNKKEFSNYERINNLPKSKIL